jgi:hypothetical protein
MELPDIIKSILGFKVAFDIQYASRISNVAEGKALMQYQKLQVQLGLINAIYKTLVVFLFLQAISPK